MTRLAKQIDDKKIDTNLRKLNEISLDSRKPQEYLNERKIKRVLGI